MMQERQRFISRSSHPKVLHLRWGWIQEMALKNPLTPLPRARSPLKPKVTYYGFLGEEWRLQTSWVAHNLGWAITSTPSCLGVQGSKRNKLEIRELDQNQVLKRWEWGSLARILALAWLSLKSPIGITQEWRKGSVRALFLLGCEFSSRFWQECWLKGYGGIFIPLHLKNSHWGQGYPETPGISPETPGQQDFILWNMVSGDSGQQGPEYPALYPEYPGLAGHKVRFCSFEWCLWFAQVFLGSIEHKF